MGPMPGESLAEYYDRVGYGYTPADRNRWDDPDVPDELLGRNARDLRRLNAQQQWQRDMEFENRQLARAAEMERNNQVIYRDPGWNGKLGADDGQRGIAPGGPQARDLGGRWDVANAVDPRVNLETANPQSGYNPSPWKASDVKAPMYDPRQNIYDDGIFEATPEGRKWFEEQGSPMPAPPQTTVPRFPYGGKTPASARAKRLNPRHTGNQQGQPAGDPTTFTRKWRWWEDFS